MIVSKFGGTSVGTYEAMQKSAEIVASNTDRTLILISATSGTTNDLVKLGAFGLDSTSQEETIIRIKERHLSIIENLENASEVESDFKKELTDLRQHMEQVARDKRWKDRLLSFGELMSTKIFIHVLKQNGVEAEWLDAREILKTDSTFGNATPDRKSLSKNLGKAVKDNKVYLTQGFIGSDIFGNTTTLGRGGSDFSAALFAEALNADLLEIWTDVAGIYSTDPRVVKEARPIKEITFDEAAELSVFGGKVLHPATLKPAIRGKVKVRVASTIEPEKPGTLIVHESSGKPVVRALSLRKNQTLLTVRSLDMLHQYGFLAELFKVLADNKISVDLVTTSEVSVSLTLDTAVNAANKVELTNEVLSELSTFCEVEIETDFCLIALIGNDLTKTAGISGSLFNKLKDYNIRMVCHGASENNICFLANETDGEAIVKLLHKKFIER
ncbi:MAG: lysine-sensitive aspartokinase 3 [Balneola sp.]|nr:lysine-sensitive aspartokinase 3 [Balneola sp.]MBO6650802.1 lysine-sensitive aspartokinase 3 [Balneola sp.]MBO6710089.1 lysine-sensitive aspartokinase 3 [Balneola sp.]MBO6798773.1 lysine-sensitive aspartokinase 3 [Balneola sp.]MBO6869887.1 lysine-sensitive aspartokinase 3 [Balneola sp.]